ncbi:MAG: sugar porter family MFS transporter [Opitutaceae bacterium]|nr:sugar porter family MFS transporter [Opitutaceae bacterium]
MTSPAQTPPSSKRFTRSVYFFGALGELMFGYDVGVIGVALLFISPEMNLTPFSQGLVVSALLAGAAVGVGCSGVLSDRFGRRPLLLAMSALFVVGGIGGGLAPSTLWLIAARGVMGLGVGASAVVVMVYLAELAPTEHRGRIAALGQFMLVCGILLSYIVAYLLQPWEAWRWMIGISAVPSLILFIGLLAMPESPRWLVQAGRPAEARTVLQRIGQGSRADTEIAAMQQSIMATQAAAMGMGRILSSPGLRRALVACCGLAVLVQLLGVNTIIYYAPTVLIKVGFAQKGAVVANLGIGATNVAMTVLALSLLDRVGRRRLLLIGSVLMTLAMVFLGGAGSAQAASGWLMLAGMLTFLGAFAMSWGACVRVVISELLPQQVRGAIMGYVLVLNWAANFSVGLLFPLLVARLGAGPTFFAFAAMGALSLVFVFRFVPETKGQTLEEIQASLQRG